MPYRRLVAWLSSLLAVVLGSGAVHAEERTWSYVTTGNGHGFQVFDASKNRIVQFLEHPYRYLRPHPTDIKQYGVGRRNLAYDVYFGLKAGSGAGWLGEPSSAEAPEQLDQTGIIHAPATAAGVKADSFFFAPFGLERNVMVSVLRAPGASDGYLLLNFHMGAGGSDTEPDATSEHVRYVAAQRAIVESSDRGGAMVYVPIGNPDGIDCEDPFNRGKAGQAFGAQTGCSRTANDVAVGYQKKLDAAGFMGVVVGFVEDAAAADALAAELVTWVGGRTADKVLDDAKAEWEAWRKPAPAGVLCSEDEKRVWRMGEATLRMGQVREANVPGVRMNHGMILASLPVGQWHTGWVRDATYAIVALARSGHFEEARKALDFFFNVEAGNVGVYKDYVGNQDYRVSVTRYFGNGVEESDWNQDGPNQQIDGWGLTLWAARVYLELSKDTAWLGTQTRGGAGGTVWDVLTQGIATPLEANLENDIVAEDCSIWETHDAKKKHFAYTTLAAARGFCDMAAVAKIGGHQAEVGKYQGLEKRVREGFLTTFADPQGGLAGNLEELSSGQYVDAAVAEAFTWNILRDWKGATARATLELLEKMRVASGGYKRNDDGLSSYDNNEWILVDFRVAGAYRRAGNAAKADGIVAKIVQKAALNFYILPELYNATASEGTIGKYFGEIPMVGYGGGAYIMTILDRAGMIEPGDCADGVVGALPKLDCSAISTVPGGEEGADGGTGPGSNDAVPDASELPFLPACLCRTGARGTLPPMALLALALGPLTLCLRRFVRSRRPFL